MWIFSMCKKQGGKERKQGKSVKNKKSYTQDRRVHGMMVGWKNGRMSSTISVRKSENKKVIMVKAFNIVNAYAP